MIEGKVRECSLFVLWLLSNIIVEVFFFDYFVLNVIGNDLIDVIERIFEGRVFFFNVFLFRC